MGVPATDLVAWGDRRLDHGGDGTFCLEQVRAAVPVQAIARGCAPANQPGSDGSAHLPLLYTYLNTRVCIIVQGEKYET